MPRTSGSWRSTRSAETFRDEDSIRVHPIITHGGSQVNVIPGEVRIETYVRGKTVEAILDANRKVDRALRAGALALGAQVEIETLPGYIPLFNHMGMKEYFKANAGALLGAEQWPRLATGAARPTWATSATSCPRCTRTWAAPPAAATAPTSPSSTRSSRTSSRRSSSR